MLFAPAPSAGAKSADTSTPTACPALNSGYCRHCKRARVGLLEPDQGVGTARPEKVLRVIEGQREEVHCHQLQPPSADRLLGLMGTGCQGLALRCTVGFLASSSGGTHALSEAVV